MNENLKIGPNYETMKVWPAVIHPKARESLRSLSKFVRQAFGKAILDLQRGRILKMPLARPMPDVGAGVHELRVKDESGAYRALYVVKFQEAVYVAHVFEKRSRTTPLRDIEIGKKRLKEMLPCEKSAPS